MLGMKSPFRNANNFNSIITSSFSFQTGDRHATQRTDKFLGLGLKDLTKQLKILGDTAFAHGHWSSIWLGELTENGQLVAVKISGVQITDTEDPVLEEAALWSRAMGHENIHLLLGFASVEWHGDTLALVSPWMPDGNIKMYLYKHPRADKLKLLAGVARGLAHLHEQGIVYGLVQETTILVSEDGNPVLCSFVFGNLVPAQEQLKDTLSSEYFKKEGLGHLEIYEKSSDVLSFGSLIVEIVPRSRKEKKALKNDILFDKLGDKKDLAPSEEILLRLVQRCWDIEPSRRPTMKEIMNCFDSLLLPQKDKVEVSEEVSPQPQMPMDISAHIKRLSENPIAGGGYCDLYLGERLGKEKVALKVVRFYGSTEVDKEKARKRFMGEASIWAGLHHPRILEFYGICDYGGLTLFMVSPFLPNGNIMRYLSEVNPDAERYRLLVEAAEGLAYLHNRVPPIIHGDLKGANILISDLGSALLADFGLARLSHEATITSLQGAGSPRWMAPELVTMDDVEGVPFKTVKSDIYAFGHVMLEILSNRPPFFNVKEDIHVLVQLIHKKRSPRPSGPIAEKWLTDTAWNYSQKCTSIDPLKRPDVAALVSELKAKSIVSSFDYESSLAFLLHSTAISED